MVVYNPITWNDEIPQTTPVKYRIKDSGGNIVYDNATVEVITPVTAGTPLNATNLNHIETGVRDAQDTANSAQTAAAAAQVDANKAVYLYSMRDFSVVIPLNEDSALTTGKKAYIPIVDKVVIGGPATLVGVYARCKGASSSGIVEFGVKNGDTNMLTTNITIDAGEVSSRTAVTPPAIGASNSVNLDDYIEVSVVQAGNGVLYACVILTFRPHE